MVPPGPPARDTRSSHPPSTGLHATAARPASPGNWDDLDLVDRTLDYSFYTSDSPSPATTSWSAAPLPLGTNLFEVTYKTNAAAWITITTPLDNLSQPFTNWVDRKKRK